MASVLRTGALAPVGQADNKGYQCAFDPERGKVVRSPEFDSVRLNL